jgi:phosphoglycolate phosphatase-like HAD superfamily hydrolase
MDQLELRAAIKVLKDNFTEFAAKEAPQKTDQVVVLTAFDLLGNLLADIKSISISLAILSNKP